MRAWGEALQRRGWPLIDASSRLLEREGYPTFEQHKLLLKNGLGQALWNALTVTGNAVFDGEVGHRAEPTLTADKRHLRYHPAS